jgi:hypothetical protein
MENIFGIATIPSIIIICYLISQGIKTTPLDNKYIPIISGVVGGILGVVAMFIVPDFPANDYLMAIAIGIVSGLSATGINQIYKQLSNK